MQAEMVEASNDGPVCNMIDLNEWIIDTSTKTMVDEIDRVNEDQQTANREFITTERTLSVTNVEAPVEENQQYPPMPWFGPAPIATQLAFSSPENSGSLCTEIFPNFAPPGTDLD